MSDEVVVRPAVAGEGDAVGALTESVYRSGGFTDDEYAEELRDGEARIRHATVLVAERDGGLVGSLTVADAGSPLGELARDGECEVRMLAVAAEAQRRGIADRLMSAAEALAAERRATAVILSTEPGMHAAHRLYRRRGYVREPARDRVIGRFELLAYRLDLR